MTTDLQCCASYSLTDRIVTYTNVYIYNFLGMYLLRLAPTVCFHFRKLISLWSRDHNLINFLNILHFLALRHGNSLSPMVELASQAGAGEGRNFQNFIFHEKNTFFGRNCTPDTQILTFGPLLKIRKFFDFGRFFHLFSTFWPPRARKSLSPPGGPAPR